MSKKPANQPMTDPFADFAEIYELTHGDKGDDLSLYLECAERAGAPILDIGCGTGRVTLALAEAGHEILGVDLSENMLKIATAKIAEYPQAVQNRIEIQQMDMSELNIPGQKFALALMPYGEFAHVLERDLHERTLRSVFVHLNEGGILVI